MTEKDILNLLEQDAWMMRVLGAAAELNLPDWLIGAGFVRNKVWDHLHVYATNTPPTDIDLIYFDPENRFNEKELASRLDDLMPGLHWEVVNQASVHQINQEAPYTSTADALSKWPETATAVGVRLEQGALKLVAPLGIEDLVHVIARPTPAFMVSDAKKTRVQERISQKHWKEKWPKLRVVMG